MDSAADSLLALSNTAAALAPMPEPEDDDDRSSSLSELDEDEADGLESDAAGAVPGFEIDSEAETERLEESPDKLPRRKSFGISPSKLAQSVNVDERPEIESLTDDSLMSSPISSREPTPDEDAVSDGPENEDDAQNEEVDRKSPTKRKREDDEQEEDDQPRIQRRRTVSVLSDVVKSDQDSEDEDDHSGQSREATVEPDVEIDGAEEDLEDDADDQAEADKAETSEDLKGKRRKSGSRSQRLRGQEETAVDIDQDVDEEQDAAEDSDEADADDAEAAAKSEEEQARRMAAMDALTALERHFATLRDRLYDERIASINQELAQLADSKPSHPELLKQLEAVRKYRDDKFEYEQKLLVYKIGALKNKSVAERSQIHSAYFQTIRDIREKHLERVSEHFYRIQRDRFKSDSTIPSYTIPFPERRSVQITQQTAYNKEVSILSGVAKYVGFPAAPELLQTQAKELDEDMQKMGISPAQIRPIRTTQKTTASNTFGGTLSGPAAEEQFLEQTPWANPQHPIHRLGLNRANSDRSIANDTFVTPASQQRISDEFQPAETSSTIAEHLSANLSSAHDMKVDSLGSGGLRNYRLQSASPLETRGINSAALGHTQARPASQPRDLPRDSESSPLNSRLGLANSPPRAASAIPDQTRQMSAGIAAGTAFTGAGRYSLV